MSSIDYSLLAEQFLSGVWEWQPQESCLTKYLGDNHQLNELKLLEDEKGNLTTEFKDAILQLLGKDVTSAVVGPFGDEDFFYGTDYDGTTSYFLQLYQVSESVLQQLSTQLEIEIHEIEE
ncbi:MAG: hypothetical protein KIT27_00760 [Legionellales bacterium]|nr:hypothetical protein [Legionellales bacterium]